MARRVLAAIVGVLVISGVAFGADFEATKVADMQKIVNNSFATVDLRHYSQVNMTDSEVDGTTPYVQSRGIIGTTFFNDMMLSYLTFGATKFTETTKVNQRRPQWDNRLSVIKGKYGEVSPYVVLYLPNQGTGTDADVGSYNEAKLPMETSIGDITVLGGFEFAASQSSREERVGVERRDPTGRFGLDNADDKKITKRDASLWTQYSTAASFTPSRLKKLTIAGTVFFTNEFEPKYREDVVDGDTRNELTGYEVKKTTTNDLTIAYKATDRLTIMNDTYQRFENFYEGRRDAGDPKAAAESALPRVTNRLMLTYTLF